MTARILRAADRPAVPWRNGGGVTREVATDGADPFRWRISIADVASDGPFSAFPGYHRTITVLRGAGMRLRIDGVEHTIAARYAPFDFDGAADTTCTLLDGPVVDFNVIATEPAAVRIVPAAAPVEVVTTGAAVVVVLENTLAVPGIGALHPFDAVALDDAVRWTVTPTAAPAVLAVVQPAG
jgi:hypothetical protein